jgi:adenylylsulfate kinase
MSGEAMPRRQIRNQPSFMKSSKDTRVRSLIKGFSWRALGTLDTMVISYIITGSPVKALSIGGIEIFTKVILYYFHERLWQKIRWGTDPEDEKQKKKVHARIEARNLHPSFDRLLQREQREAFLGQKSKVLWLTGLSGSGKTTIAQLLEARLFEEGVFSQVLDGDNIRTGINSNLGFSIEDRQENIRRIAEIAKLYAQTGIVTICTFISPTREMRAFARQTIGEQDFREIYINAPLDVCEARDVKGLYKKARGGELKNFTGIDSPYEPPLTPDLEIQTHKESVESSVEQILDYLLPQIMY